MKGTGKLTQIPWFLKKNFENEDLDTNRVYSESVSRISFKDQILLEKNNFGSCIG